MTGRLRNRKGAAKIAEFAVSMVIIIPLLITIVYVILEVSHAYLIWSGLQQGAQEAARLLATYPASPTSNYQTLTPQQINNVLAQVQNPQVINDYHQFSYPQTPPFTGQSYFYYPTAGAPPTEAGVTVKYLSGQYGLPVFPDADVLNLGSKFTLQASAVYQVN